MQKTTKTQETSNKMAVIRTGGRQFCVKEGQIIKIEKLPQESIKNSKDIIFEDVLLVSEGENVQIGTPNIKSKVSAELIESARDKKVIVIHYKAKSRYFKKNGHRQPYMKVKISNIS
ncbi:MAG TPA: 50S ribosomal protein L21 [Candidatus Paceibacterota bacterium]|nr:50S ribosomal protein L21 [Candidatus Paceibacterota bacterium]HMP18724.1 50S ribosomal protein L21 [Candidatus Paceibacterota bacterium]HMP85590.1 50S ribosomal protein L21 [Candidatus Paceibacterota bacterium]